VPRGREAGETLRQPYARREIDKQEFDIEDVISDIDGTTACSDHPDFTVPVTNPMRAPEMAL